MNIVTNLKNKALKTLNANIIHTASGDLIAAGGNQFRTLWVRDFCYSVPGLLKTGHTELVLRQLQTILSFKNKQHFLPRGIDVINPKLRVVMNSFIKNPRFNYLKYADKKLIPEYLGEHNTVAFDSNLLFLQAAQQYSDFTRQQNFLTAQEINELLSIYIQKTSSLIEQPAYSDWQDSVERKGHLLLTQLLFIRVVDQYKTSGIKHIYSEYSSYLLEQIQSEFFDASAGLYFEQKGAPQHSLDSHVFLIEHNRLFGINASELYNSLKQSPLWNATLIPGRPVDTNYNSRQISWTTKFVGLRHYHDEFIWGWLSAEAYKIAKFNQDTEEMKRILDRFTKMNTDYELLSEVYEEYSKKTIKSVRRVFYRSECPFTWTAAKWLEAIC